MKLIDRGRTHLMVADRLIVEWSGRARSTVHPLLDDAMIRAATDTAVLDFHGWALRCSLSPADPGRHVRLVAFGTRPRRLLPQLHRSLLTKRGRQIRRTMRGGPSTPATMGSYGAGYATGEDAPAAPPLGDRCCKPPAGRGR